MTDFYSAKHYAKKAEKWATGTMAECPDGSAKHWAQVAEATAGSIGDPANRDLSNLTDEGLSRLSNLPLFVSFKTGHILNNASYVNGRLFSWLSGAVYASAYNELVNELNAQKKAFYQFWTGSEPFFTLSYAPSVGDMAYTIQNGYAIEKSTIANIGYAELGSVMEITLQDGSMGQRDVGSTDVDQEAYIARSIAINDIAVNYFLTDTNKKICLSDQADNVAALYTTTGAADFYLLDTANTQFKLPRRNARRLLRAYKEGEQWYNLYSDGWVEQGGERIDSQTSSFEFPISFASTDYTLNATMKRLTGDVANFSVCYDNKTNSSIIVQLRKNGAGVGGTYLWQASGYADTSLLQDEFEYEYFFLGTSVNETSVDVGQIATALTGKADVDLSNTTPSSAFKSQSAGWGMPDYSSQVTKSTPFTTEFDCYVHCLVGTTVAFGTTQLLANGVVVDRDVNQTNNTNNVITSLKGFILKGCTVTVAGGSSTTATCFVTPLKGASNA